MMQPELKIFYCYAREDEDYRKKLEEHMAHLKRRYNLKTWFDREILPGENWEGMIESNLNSADLILLLISPALMNSDYCYNKEMARALERHKKGEAKVIPVIVRRVYWEDTLLSSIQALPTDGVPIASWSDKDDAFYNVVIGIESVIKSFIPSLQTSSVLPEPHTSLDLAGTFAREGDMLQGLQRYEEALAAYDKAIRLDPHHPHIYHVKGCTLHLLGRNAEAITAFDQALGFDPHYSYTYHWKGCALSGLQRLEEAVAAFDQALRINPDYSEAHHCKGCALRGLGRNGEAVAVFDQALRIDPNNSYTYHWKGLALDTLQHYAEAVAAFDQALRINPDNAYTHHWKGHALLNIKRYAETIQACNQAIRIKPDYPEAYQNKGIALQQLGRTNEAQEAYQKAQELYGLRNK